LRCLGTVAGTHRLEILHRPEPPLPGAGQVLIEMVECGVCGTDRHILAGSFRRPAPGQTDLVMGHEPLGRVLAIGPGVSHLGEGDYVAATNQRSCGRCAACVAGEVDLCLTAAGTGRGVGGLDGFLQPRLLDDADFCVRVPAALAPVAVLTEPLAVNEKWIQQVRQVQRRLWRSPWTDQAEAPDWAAGLRFAVGGAGPIGLLAAVALRCHGATVEVLDRAPATGTKAALARAIGATYRCTADLDLASLADVLGHVDCAVEASGSAELCLALWRALGHNGAFVVVGGPGGPQAPIPPRELFGRAIGRNLALIGTVASNPRHFALAVEDLALAERCFPGALAALITARWDFDHADQAVAPGGPDDIKRVITMAGSG
jgi:threonine dehydrogenase-like Zn-dependent dehydrogenase